MSLKHVLFKGAVSDLISTGEMTVSSEKTCQMPQAMVAARIVNVTM